MITIEPTVTIEDSKYFDLLADLEASHWWSKAMWRIASDLLNSALEGRRGLDALDLGCGAGLSAVRLARLPQIARVIALDPRSEALDWSRRRHRFPLVQGSAIDLPFADNSTDVILCCDVLQHLPERTDRVALGEMSRILRPGGVLLLRSNARRMIRSTRWADEPRYRLGDIIALANGAGLLPVFASYANCLPGLVEEYRAWRARARRIEPRRGLTVKPSQDRLYGFKAGIAATEALMVTRLGMRLPWGHSTVVLAQKHEHSLKVI